VGIGEQFEFEKTGRIEDRVRLKHKFIKHQNCEIINCYICDGGLADCEICNCAEASLPTDCPGRKVSGELQDKIMDGDLDFIDGHWKKNQNV
jgi:hypothetical protein